MPSWTKAAIDAWAWATGITGGRVFREVNKGDNVMGEGMTAQGRRNVVTSYVGGLRLDNVAPHDLRRTFAKLALFLVTLSCLGASQSSGYFLLSLIFSSISFLHFLTTKYPIYPTTIKTPIAMIVSILSPPLLNQSFFLFLSVSFSSHRSVAFPRKTKEVLS
jgi:hypothetical protein